MMRSLYSAISGLNGFQTKMDVLGNNIANVDTTGFKSSRVDFATALSQVTKGASSPSTASNLGGTNAVQIGLGQTYTTQQNMTQGSAETTGVNTDLMLQGDGFFVMKDGANTVYTRAGGFSTDSNGTLEDPATGAKVQGYSWSTADTSGAPVWTATGDINLKTGSVMPGDGGIYPVQEESPVNLISTNLTQVTGSTPSYVAGGSISFVGAEDLTIDGMTRVAVGTTPSAGQYSFDPSTGKLTFASGFTLPTSSTTNIHYIEPSGTSGSKNTSAAPVITSDSSSNTYTAIVAYPPLDGATVYLTADNPPTSTSTVASYTYTDSATPGNGQYTLSNVNGQYQLTFGPTYTAADGTTPSTSTVLTTTPSTISYDFTNQAHTLSSFTIDQSGVITGVYSNGTDTVTHKIAQIAVATFPNDAGLQNIGGNFYTTSNNSGTASVGAAGQNGAGSIESGELEMSNVNLAQEFTDMIIAQRGFEANSRVITVGDTILSTVVNMKTS
jgi:flagellar hook protein FlgE